MMNPLSLKTLAAYAYPYGSDTGYWSTWVHRSKFRLRSMLHYSAFHTLIDGLNFYTLLMMLQRHQQFLDKPMRPYLNRHYSAKQRARLITLHYRFIEREMKLLLVNRIYRQDCGITLFHIEVDEQRYSMSLCYDSDYRREGEMALVLRDVENRAFYAVAFSLAYEHGVRTLRIGGLQGPESCEQNRHTIKRMTKALHGQRPKDLMLRILMILARRWHIDQVLAVRNGAHVYRAKRYAKGKVKADYDAHWRSFGGTEFDRHFYLLPQAERRKAEAEIARPKRAMYRRRYAWLDDTAEQIRAVLN